MLQVTLSQSAKERMAGSDEEGEEVDPDEPTTSSGVRARSSGSSSQAPPPKKHKGPQSSSSGQYSASYVADVMKDYLAGRHTEAEEVKAEVNIHPFCTDIA